MSVEAVLSPAVARALFPAVLVWLYLARESLKHAPIGAVLGAKAEVP